MKQYKLLIMGGSAGSLQVILSVLMTLGNNFPIPVLIVLHRNNMFESNLEELLSARTGLTIKEVEEKDILQPGIVYICPADYHVLIESDHSFSLDYSERVFFSRPSIDVTFASAAEVYGPELIALLLSGGNADGVQGLACVRDRGGLIVVQDPATADVPYMPQQAVNRLQPELVLATEEIPSFIRGLGFNPYK